MTNAEKFKEVFGHDVETNACPQKDVECEKCELFNDRTCTETFWNSKYIAPPVEVKRDKNGFSDYAEFDGA